MQFVTPSEILVAEHWLAITGKAYDTLKTFNELVYGHEISKDLKFCL